MARDRYQHCVQRKGGSLRRDRCPLCQFGKQNAPSSGSMLSTRSVIWVYRASRPAHRSSFQQFWAVFPFQQLTARSRATTGASPGRSSPSATDLAKHRKAKWNTSPKTGRGSLRVSGSQKTANRERCDSPSVVVGGQDGHLQVWQSSGNQGYELHCGSLVRLNVTTMRSQNGVRSGGWNPKMKTVLRGARLRLFLAFIGSVAILPVSLSSQERIDSKLVSGMQWRLIGPFRAGRVTAVAGAADPNTYYFGTPGGGVWKTTDGGQVWHPIFDKERVASIGALGVAPSDSNVLYVGTGEQTRGNGVYRSMDAGATWKNVGLQDVPFIQAIIVDPKNPDLAVVGGNSLGVGLLWRPFPLTAKTANRGIFKTVDGGKNWTKVFSPEDSIGVVDLCSDPSDPSTLYAVLYRPGSGSGDSEIEATSDIVKSGDGGSTWTPLASTGLPEKARGRLGIAVAPGTSGRRLYAILKQGFFRSDDGGATWQPSTKDPRVTGNEYFSRVFVDARNPDV